MQATKINLDNPPDLESDVDDEDEEEEGVGGVGVVVWVGIP